MPTVLTIALALFLAACLLIVYAALVAGARTDEAIQRAILPPTQLRAELERECLDAGEGLGTVPVDPRLWHEEAAWLNSAGELRVGPLVIANIKRFPCRAQYAGVTIYGRTLMEVADVMARIEVLGEVA